MLGAPVYGKISWSVTTALKMVNFYIESCDVIFPNNQISVIDKNCYSETFEARQMQQNKVVETSAAFTFRSFIVGKGTVL